MMHYSWTDILLLFVLALCPLHNTFADEETVNIPHAPLPPDISFTSHSASATPAPMTEELIHLRHQIHRVLAAYRQRPLNTLEHTPWDIMHWSLAWGAGATIRHGNNNGDIVRAFDWLNRGGRCNGQVMVASDQGRLVALQGKGMQGHTSQYLAIMAQARLPESTPITIDGMQFSIEDLIQFEQKGCHQKNELTFTLIAMAHYLHTNAIWKSRNGATWSLTRLVEEELKQPVFGAPCGGTHRLYALAYACQQRREAMGELDGVYVQANRNYRLLQQKMFRELQNSDGSFSTAWFERPENGWDVERKLRTTGHVLEFLVATAEQPVLYHPKTIKAVAYLAGILEKEPNKAWKIGPMSHALHCLAIYQERAWSGLTPGAIAAFDGDMRAKAAPMPPQPKPSFRLSLKPLQSMFK
ncbi:MAG: hypothetical protein ABGW78_15525 [Pirellulales bacterium]